MNISNKTLKTLMPLCSLLLLLTVASTCFAQHAEPPQKPSVDLLPSLAQQSLQNGIDSMRAERESLAHKISQLDADMSTWVNERQKLIKQHEVSPESIVEMTRMLQTQRVELDIDLAGLNARRTFLQEAAKQMQVENNDEVLAPLKAVLALAKERLAELKQGLETRRASRDEVREAETRVLRAEISLAEAKRNNTQLSGLSAELLDASLERAEKMARREAVQEMLKSIAAARTDVESVKRIDAQVESLNESLAEYQKRVRDLEISLAWQEKKLKESMPKE